MPHLTKRSALARLALSVVGVTGIALATGCSSDAVTAPANVAPPGFTVTSYKSIKVSIGDIMKMLFPMESLTRDVALKQPITRSFTFDRKGGRIEIKETGLRVEVPPGAIPGSSLTITVTALPGEEIAYDFQPHGTVFLKPLQFIQDLNNTSWDNSGFKGVVLGGYFENAEQLHLLNGLSLLDELYPVTIDSKRASFDIKHFSGYMVSSGRQGAYSDSSF